MSVLVDKVEEMNWLTLVDVGQDTALGDCDVAEQLVQLLVVADGELEMTRNDTGLLVVTSGIAGQLEDFSCQVLEDGCEVDGSA
jgi:hypothetical protein